MSTATPAWVLGYASLLADGAPARGHRLVGYRRRWGVAMDNTVTIPGYKCYLDSVTGSRPRVHVCFLDLVEAPGAAITGVLLPVTPQRLAVLDRRERNYRRVDVSDRVDPPVRGRVAAYVGSPAGRDRFARGLAEGSAVVAQGYLDRVVAGFTRAGRAALAELRAGTEPCPCPVVPLRRVDLP